MGVYWSCLAFTLLLRCMIGLWGYSGHAKPVMFGDFEAQRHWMEITVSLPFGDWYRNTSDNDLQYWGLDYPPLTAFVSQVFGSIAKVLYPPLVMLNESRGHESSLGKLFMRASVLACDTVVYYPAILLWTSYRFSSSKFIKFPMKSLRLFVALTLIVRLLIPSLVLIDHGHFQYNCVCLGLSLLGGFFIVKDCDLIGSFFFCLSLNFKQMSLYYAPVFFCCLLRKCIMKGGDFFRHLFLIALTVISTFGLLWFPFCIYASADETCVSSLLHVLSRQFPFSRGLFEDKVSNIWYTLSVIVDMRSMLPVDALVKLSLALTLLLLTPTVVDLMRRPACSERFLLSLCNSSLAFFLASYQVHEKSLLLMLAPASLLMADDLMTFGWLQVLGTFSMFPLLVRDGLSLPYFACIAIFLVLLAFLHEYTPPSRPPPKAESYSPTVVSWSETVRRWKPLFLLTSSTGMLLLHVMHAVVPAPPRYPDLYPSLFSIYSALNLICVYLYGVVWQYSLPS